MASQSSPIPPCKCILLKDNECSPSCIMIVIVGLCAVKSILVHRT